MRCFGVCEGVDGQRAEAVSLGGEDNEGEGRREKGEHGGGKPRW